jgi:hypothetical protein
MTSRNVPCLPSLPVERGNSSYQLEKRAWTGSTTMPYRSDSAASDRSAWTVISRSRVGESASPVWPARSRPAELDSASASSPEARDPAASTTSAPISRSTATSWPASIRLARSRRHVCQASVQATTRYSCRPTESTLKDARQRSL